MYNQNYGLCLSTLSQRQFIYFNLQVNLGNFEQKFVDYYNRIIYLN